MCAGILCCLCCWLTAVLFLWTAETRKPFSWAALASKNTPGSVGGSPSAPSFGTASQIKPSRPVEPKADAGPVGPSKSAVPAGSSQPQPQRVPRYGGPAHKFAKGGGGGGGGVQFLLYYWALCQVLKGKWATHSSWLLYGFFVSRLPVISRVVGL